MINRVILLLALGASACDRDGEDNAAARSTAVARPIQPAADQMNQTPMVVPKPKDQAKLDQMILTGYTPHADHLHPPGVDKCPLTKGSEAVM